MNSPFPSWFTQQMAFAAEKAQTVILESGYHAPMLFTSAGRRGPVEIIPMDSWSPEWRPYWRMVCEVLVASAHAAALFHISEAWMAHGPEALAYRRQHSLASYAGRIEVLMVEGVCRQGFTSRVYALIRERPQDDTSRLLRVEPWEPPEHSVGESYLLSGLPWPEKGGA